MSKRMLIVTICCDVDPDVVGYNIPATRFDVYKEKLGWKGIENIPKIREICNSVEDSESNNLKITWHIRSDAQLKTIFNDYAYPLRNFQDLWRELEQQGDEIGWHPHLWRWSKQNKCWYQEVSDKEWICHCLENGHKEFLKLHPNLTSIRMGWAFHNNFTMKIVNDLGLTVDLSASPGLKYEGSPDERGSHFLNEYDWSLTTETPYHPSKDDYRRPAKDNEQSLSILEIPLTTHTKTLIKILFEEIAALAPLAAKRRVIKGWSLQSKRVQRKFVANVTNTSFKILAEQKFKEVKRNPEFNTNLIAQFHPIELFKPNGFLIFQNNLKTLRDMSKRLAVPLRFLTATQMAEKLTEMSITKSSLGHEKWFPENI